MPTGGIPNYIRLGPTIKRAERVLSNFIIAQVADCVVMITYGLQINQNTVRSPVSRLTGWQQSAASRRWKKACEWQDDLTDYPPKPQRLYPEMHAHGQAAPLFLWAIRAGVIRVLRPHRQRWGNPGPTGLRRRARTARHCGYKHGLCQMGTERGQPGRDPPR